MDDKEWEGDESVPEAGQGQAIAPTMDDKEWYMCQNSRREGEFCLLALFPTLKSMGGMAGSDFF